MAKLVTRTFTGTKIEVLVYDKENKVTDEITMVINNRKFKDYKALEKVAKAQLKEMSDTLTFVAVLNTYVFSEKRCMTVQHFFDESEPVIK